MAQIRSAHLHAQLRPKIAKAAAPRTAPSVAHIVLSLDSGGLEHLVLELITSGQSRNQVVNVLCIEHPGTLAEEAQRRGASVLCVDKPARLRLRSIRDTRAQLQVLNPDVVHTHQAGALFYAGPAAKSLGIPVIHTEHGKHYTHWRKRSLGRVASLFANRFCCVSQDIAADVIRHKVAPQRKVHVVPNGIDLARFNSPASTSVFRSSLGIPERALVVGTVGRLNEVKRQDLLLMATAEIRRKGIDCHLLVVGDGPMKDSLHELTRDLALAPYAHFVGNQPAPEQFLRLMDVFALTSRSEGMPLAVLEAWAAGVPVVASSVGGIPELIEHGRHGLLFPSADLAALVASISAVFSDRELQGRLSSEGLRRVTSGFGRSEMAARYDAHYHAVLHERS